MSAETIRRITIAELEQAPFLDEFIAAYGDESSIPEIGDPEPCFETYRAMEASGVLHVLGAFAPDLVGVASVLVFGLPHYAGRKIASMESIFVMPSARRSGAGLGLLRAAEQCAREQGAKALMVSAPVGGRLAAVMSKTEYRETSRVFAKGLA